MLFYFSMSVGRSRGSAGSAFLDQCSSENNSIDLAFLPDPPRPRPDNMILLMTGGWEYPMKRLSQFTNFFLICTIPHNNIRIRATYLSWTTVASFSRQNVYTYGRPSSRTGVCRESQEQAVTLRRNTKLGCARSGVDAGTRSLSGGPALLMEGIEYTHSTVDSLSLRA